MHPSLQWFLKEFPYFSAALIAMGGVVFTQLCLFRVERRRRQTERRKDFMQRRFAFKREIYMAVTAALMEATNKMIKVPAMSPEDFGNYELSPDAMKALGSKDLISNREVTQALGSALRVQRQCFFSLVPIKNEELLVAAKLSVLSKRIDGLQQLSDRLNDDLMQLAGSAPDVSERREAVYSRFQFVHERLMPLYDEQALLMQTKASYQEELGKMTPPLVHACKVAAAKVSMAMRSDLGFSTNLRIEDLTLDDDAGMRETAAVIEKSWQLARSAMRAQ